MNQLQSLDKDLTIAVAIPCYNEAATISKVINDFRAILPEAPIHVFDNNSTDGSANLAIEAGATMHYVRKQGKGNVMQAIFETITADALIIVDGDDTYDALEAPKLLEPILRGEADMVVGNRLAGGARDSLGRLHEFGNHLIVACINFMFASTFWDVLSGYRILNRRVVNSVSLLTPGFETETELTLRALIEGVEVIEIPISYRSRPVGSESKLRTFRDGYRIMMAASILLRDLYPLRLFGVASLVCLLIVLTATVLRILTYFGSLTLPTTLLTGGVLLFAPLSLVLLGIGLTLNVINTRFREMNQILRRIKETDVK
jgi:glycosyltransferase involved in cell wall biosynthesis